MDRCFEGKKSPRDLRARIIPAAARLLVVAPHPDDFDAIGITLKLLATQGHPLQAIVSQTGSGVEASYRPGLTLAGMARLREQEQRNSARFFGLPDDGLTFVQWHNDAEEQPLDNPDNLATMDLLIRQAAPDLLFLPHGNDSNGGHRAIFSLVQQAVSRFPQPPALLLIRDPKTIAMTVDFYVAFGEAEAAWKGELLRFHDTQHQRNLNSRGRGFDARILDFNRQVAQELALAEPYAEAFELKLCRPAAV
jgi:LmbE family N-acetylglucosaminyl deacetylase